MIQPKTFAQWLANYTDKPTPRGQFARDWALLRDPVADVHDGFSDEALIQLVERGRWAAETERMATCGLWNDGGPYDAAVVYYAARRAYAVYTMRHVAKYGAGGQ